MLYATGTIQAMPAYRLCYSAIVWKYGSGNVAVWTDSTENFKGPHKSLPANPLLADPMYWNGYIEKSEPVLRTSLRSVANMD